MEKGKYYLIWYKDDKGQTRDRAIQFLGTTDIDVEYINIVTGRKESIFKGTFTRFRGRTKSYESLEDLKKELDKTRIEKEKRKRKNNGQDKYYRSTSKQFS